MKTKSSRFLFLPIAVICLLIASDLLAQDPREAIRRALSGRTGGSRTGTSSVQRQSSQVVAVADERSNSIIVIASTNIHNEIQSLITQIDSNVDDVTEVRVFPLKHADPTEMSEVLTQLFTDQGQNAQQTSGFRLPFLFGARGGGGNQQALRSDQRVVAVPDPRSTSIIVSAPRQMMDQISQMIQQLDSSNGKKQTVRTITLKHADVAKVEEILRGMFEGQNSRNTQNQQQNNSALNQRAGGFGTAGATAGGGGGGGGGGAFGRN